MNGISCGHRILYLQGNLFYFSSFMWLLLLILMTINAAANYFHKTIYFLTERSLFPMWTVEHHKLSLNLLITTAVFLFSPKILSILLVTLSREKAARFGGVLRMSLSVLLETVFSTLLAPLRMLFHAWYCVLNLIGRKLTWGSQARLQKRTSFREALTFSDWYRPAPGWNVVSLSGLKVFNHPGWVKSPPQYRIGRTHWAWYFPPAGPSNSP